MNALCRPSLGASGYVTKILQVKNGQKLTNLNQYISVIANIDKKRFVSFEHIIKCLSFAYVRLPQLEYYFFCFASFFLLFFSFFLLLSTFKLQNALFSKFEQLKILVRTFVQQKLGARLGAPSIGSSKILNF